MMNPILEKFELDFAGLKAGKISAYDFFNSLWEPLSVIKGGAKDFLDRVQAWSETGGSPDPKNYGLATLSLSLVAMHEDWIEDGLRWSSEAHRIFEDIRDEDGMAMSGLLIGTFYRTLGNIDIALRYVFSSWNQLKKSEKYPFHYCACSYQLSELYMETKAYDRAIQTYEDCARMADKYGYLAFQALSLSGKALAYHALGQNDLARESFLRALPLLANTKFKNPYTRLLSDYGTFLMNEGDYGQAIECHTTSMKLRSENRMQLGSITNMIQLGKIYLLQGKKDDALSIWQQGLDQAISLNAKLKICQLHLLLSEFYESNKDIDKSLAHYRSFHNVHEEVNKEDGEKKVKRAEILFAAEQTEKENAIIKAQKAEIEIKNKELQETIDELTITKVSRRAKALTLLVAIVMIIAEEPIMRMILHYIGEENIYFMMGAKILVILSLKPIDSAIEHYLLRRVILKKKGHVRY